MRHSGSARLNRCQCTATVLGVIEPSDVSATRGEMLRTAGFGVRAQLVREPEESEQTPQAFILATSITCA